MCSCGRGWYATAEQVENLDNRQVCTRGEVEGWEERKLVVVICFVRRGPGRTLRKLNRGILRLGVDFDSFRLGNCQLSR